MMSSTQVAHSRGESEEYEEEGVNNISQSTKVGQADLLRCGKTHLGNQSVYHGAVNVNNLVKLSVQDAHTASVASTSASCNSRIENTQNHNVLAQPMVNHASLSGNNRRQHFESSDDQESNVIQPGECISTNDTSPVLPQTDRTNKGFRKNIVYLCIAILGVSMLILLLIYEIIVYYGNNPADEDNLPMNFTERLITRGKWLALQPKHVIPVFKFNPPPFVIVGHTAGHQCYDSNSCRIAVRKIQEWQFENNFFDIMYNYLVGGNGYIYEGRGWNEFSAGIKRMECSALFVGFIGTFVVDRPPVKQINALKLLLDEGVQSGKLDENYKMFLQKQITITESPGEALIEILIDWPHWSPFNKEDYVCDNNGTIVT